MPATTTDLSSPVNHIFVDFENVHKIDPAIIGSKAVSFTLLIGARQTKLEVSLVEKLFEHAASVQLVRIASSGPNALDFILTYYVGRAVATDPTGCFHIVSGDKDFDPLIEHLRSKSIRVQRHDSFATLTFAGAAKSIAPTVTPTPKSRPKSKAQSLIRDERTIQVLNHLRKPSATHPKNKKKLLSYLVAYLGHKITEAEALDIIEKLRRAGHLAIGERGAVTYHLDHG